MTPILIRTKDRPHYLHTTLKSLMATNLYDGLVIIADDCSTDKITNDYLFTNKIVKFKDYTWYEELENEITEVGSIFKNSPDKGKTNKEIWDQYIGNVPIETYALGLKNKFNIIQPKENKGVKGGLLWTIAAGFTLFRNAEKIIVLKDDLLFNKNWLKIANLIYEREKQSNLGCVSVYNREIKSTNDFLYTERPHIGGVMYLIPRKVYRLMKDDNLFNKVFSPNENGGDVFFLEWLESKGLKVLNSSSSYIQHIGIKSLSRPGRFLRYSLNFTKPYAWDRKFDHE